MTTDRYREAAEEARNQEDRIVQSAHQSIQHFSLVFVNNIGAALKRSRGEVPHRYLNDEATALSHNISDSISTSIEHMVDYTVSIWRKASRDTFQDHGEDHLLYDFFHDPTLLAAAIIATINVSQWKTLVSVYVKNGAAEVAAIVQSALSLGMDVELLARKLRRYVLGSDPFKLLFNEEGMIDLRGIPRYARGAAKTMVFNASRIAFSETHNARATSEVRLFISDPLVAAVDWLLSPNRGNWTPPDECDLLATIDWYGLGNGRFPVTQVPYPPHPFDRCERFPIKRSLNEAGDVKPSPELLGTPLDPSFAPFPRGSKITARAAEVARQRAWEAMTNPLS